MSIPVSRSGMYRTSVQQQTVSNNLKVGGLAIDRGSHNSLSPSSGNRIDNRSSAIMSSRRRGSGSSQATTNILDFLKPDPWGMQRKLRIPLSLTVIVAMALFTVAPALIVWLLSWQAGKEGINSMESLGNSAVEDVALQLRLSLMKSTTSSVLQIVSPTETVLRSLVLQLKRSNVLTWSGSTIGQNYSQILEDVDLFMAIKANLYISMLSISTYFDAEYNYAERQFYTKQQWTAFSRLNIDVVTGIHDENIYIAEQVLVPPVMNSTAMTYYVIDQVTSVRLFPVFQLPLPLDRAPVDPTKAELGEWVLDIDFNPNTGMPQILMNYWVPTNDNSGSVHFTIYTNVYIVSSYLRSIINGTKERLFLNFRTPAGVLIGASHGRFFSHSDVDYSANNPLLNPPPVSSFRKYSPVNSSDTMISATAQWLISVYTTWELLPELNVVQTILGEAFWVANSIISTEKGLRANIVLIIDRESKMGAIERNRQHTEETVRKTNQFNILILCIIVGLALVFATVISIMLIRPLGRLGFGMDSLAMLQFDDADRHSLLKTQSFFREMAKCEHSFLALERGLKAFIKYVPKEVVRMMLSGAMESTHLMHRRVVSVLFMDIVGFSTMCEKVPADVLMRLTIDYLDAMCEIIVTSGGTLDKFIGDCVMAMWNAPRTLKQHESHAVGAVLEMQMALMDLCKEWAQDGIPEIRFRAGINSDAVLVGNFGCDYRISYTCLGDGVNLASRLEGANKHFKTVCMVAESTRNNAGSNFLFRKIGHITVPGKAEIVTVYEPLYRLSGDTSDGEEEIENNTMRVAPADMLVSNGGGGGGNHSPAMSPTVSASTRMATMDTVDSGGECSRVLLPHAVSATSSPLVEPSVPPRPLVQAAGIHVASGGAEPSMLPQPAQVGDPMVLYNWQLVSRLNLRKMVAHYEKGLAQYLAGNLAIAQSFLVQAKALFYDDGPTSYLLDQCNIHLLAQSSNTHIVGTWDGVLRFDQK